MKKLVMLNEQQKKHEAIIDAQNLYVAKGINIIGYQEVEMDMTLIDAAKKHGIKVERSGNKFYSIIEDTFGSKIDKEIICVEFKTR